ncbi:MAG: DUF1295 domain-containing protein [Pseudomonadota bacterium]
MLEIYLVPLGVALVGFVIIWPASVVRRDVSLVDLAWGPGFFVQLCAAALVAGALDLRGQMVLAVVGIWSARLAWTLGARRFREGHEDPRYTSIRESWGPAFWWKSIFIVFALQAFLQWLIVVGPIAGLAAEPQALGALAWIGVATALGGLALEAVADRQLDTFKRTAQPGALMTSGLRAHMRHPNYTGEIIFWIGVALILVDGGVWLGLLSPVLITLFLTKVSGAPLLDERLSETRPGYAAYRARVPGFIPFLTPERSNAS